MRQSLWFAAFAALFIGLTPVPAYAYLDAGTGSMLLQAIAAAVLGSLFAIKVFWRGIVARFSRRKNESLIASSSNTTDGQS